MCTGEQASTWKKQWFQFNKIEERHMLTDEQGSSWAKSNEHKPKSCSSVDMNFLPFFWNHGFLASISPLPFCWIVSSLYFVNISFPFYWNEFIAFFQLNAWSSGGVYFLALRWIESRCFLSARSSFVGEYVFSSILLNWVHGFRSVRSFFVRISFVLCWMIKFMAFIN